MRVTRGHRPCRGLRSSSARRAIIRRAVKSQLRDGRVVGAEQQASVEDHAWNGVHVSLQHLPAQVSETQHALPLVETGPQVPLTDSAVPFQPLASPATAREQLQRPAPTSDGNEGPLRSGYRGCDCPPSTSGSGSSSIGSVSTGGAGTGVWQGPGQLTGRDAAALTRRIRLCRSVAELAEVVRRYRLQLNHIHVAAAIVKLAKLAPARTSGLAAAERHRRRQLQEQQREEAGHGFRRHGGPQESWVSQQSGVGGDAVPLHAGRHDAGERVQAQTVSGHGSWSPELTPSGSVASLSAAWATSNNSAAAPGGVNPGHETHPHNHSRLGQAERIGAPPPPPPPGAPGQGPLAAVAASTISMSGVSASPTDEDDDDLDYLLAQLTSSFLPQLPHCDTARQVANVVWALGSLRSLHDHSELLAAAAVLLLERGATRLARARPEELVSLALGLARLGYREVPLWAAIITASKAQLQDFKPLELHNMAWAVAKARQDRSMVSAVVQSALPRLRGFDSGGLASLLWACAAAACPCEELFDGAAAVLLGRPSREMAPQDVANTAWAFAKLQHAHPRLFSYLAAAVLQAGHGGLRAAATQELVNMLWAFASLPAAVLAPGLSGPLNTQGPVQGHQVQHQQPSDTVTMAGSAMGREGDDRQQGPRPALEDQGDGQQGLRLPDTLDRLPVRAAQNSAQLSGDLHHTDATAHGNRAGGPSPTGSLDEASWPAALASAGADAGPLAAGSGISGDTLRALVHTLVSELSRRPNLTPQGVSNTLWALARLQPLPLPATQLTALIAAADARAASMSDQELTTSLWGAGKLRRAGHWVPPKAVAALAAAATATARLEVIPPAGLAQLVDAAVSLRLVGSALMAALAGRVLRSLADLQPQELCVMAVAVADAARMARYVNPVLMNALGNAASASVERMDPQGLTNILWAFARAKHYHGPLTTSVCRVAQNRLERFKDAELANLVWAMAVLKCQDRQLLVRVARLVVARVRFRRQRRAAAAAFEAAAAGGPSGGQRRDGEGRTEAEARAGERVGPRKEPGGLGRTDSRPERGPELSPLVVPSELPTGGPAGPSQMSQHSLELQLQEPQNGFVPQSRTAAGVQPDLAGDHQHIGQLQTPQHGGDAVAVPHWLLDDGSRTALRLGQGEGVPKAGANDGSGSACIELDGGGFKRLDQARAASRASDASATGADRQEQPSRSTASAVLDHGNLASLPPLPLPPGPSVAESRTRLRRLPSFDQSSETDLQLQPHRPPPRDPAAVSRDAAAAVAAARRRRDREGGADAAAAGAAGTRRHGGRNGSAGPERGTAYASASLSSIDVTLSDGEADEDERAVVGGAVSPRDHAKSMAKLLWSYAKCNLYNQSLFRLLGQELQPLLALLTPHELTQVIWAMASHSHSCPDLLNAAARVVLSRLRFLCPWDGSVIAWAYGKLRHPHRGLLEGLQRHALRGEPYNEPCLCRLAWACSQLSVPLEEPLQARLHAVRMVARQRMTHSSYDGADGAVAAAGASGADPGRAEW